MKTRWIVAIIATVCVFSPARSQETPQQKAERMSWFKDLK